MDTLFELKRKLKLLHDSFEELYNSAMHSKGGFDVWEHVARVADEIEEVSLELADQDRQSWVANKFGGKMLATRWMSLAKEMEDSQKDWDFNSDVQREDWNEFGAIIMKDALSLIDETREARVGNPKLEALLNKVEQARAFYSYGDARRMFPIFESIAHELEGGITTSNKLLANRLRKVADELESPEADHGEIVQLLKGNSGLIARLTSVIKNRYVDFYALAKQWIKDMETEETMYDIQSSYWGDVENISSHLLDDLGNIIEDYLPESESGLGSDYVTDIVNPAKIISELFEGDAHILASLIDRISPQNGAFNDLLGLMKEYGTESSIEFVKELFCDPKMYHELR